MRNRRSAGTGKFGKALKEELRGPVRTSEEDAKRLLDGSAWSEFCRSLDLAGRHLLAYPTKSTPVPGEVESEGVRYGLGLVTAGILQALQLSDPATPRIVRNPDSESKWGAENVDNQYLWARISPEHQYRVFGNRNNIFEALLETKDGYMQIGDDRVFETLFLTEMTCEKDGSFEVLLAAERPAGHQGNFMKMPPGTQYFCVRQYFVDWEKEWPARFEIERIGGLGVRPAPYTAAKTAQLLDEAGLWVLQSARFWTEWVDQLRRDFVKGELKPAATFVGGARDIFYGNDWWSLAPRRGDDHRVRAAGRALLADAALRRLVPDDGLRDASVRLEPPSGAPRQGRQGPHRRRPPRPRHPELARHRRPSRRHAPVPLDLHEDESPPDA